MTMSIFIVIVHHAFGDFKIAFAWNDKQTLQEELERRFGTETKYTVESEHWEWVAIK